MKDNRIEAFVALAPALGQGFMSEKLFLNVEKPILIIGASKDNRAPVATNAGHYHKMIPISKYVELNGEVGHYIFMNEAKSGLKRAAPIIFKDGETISRKEIHIEVSDLIQTFLTENLN